ncbi:MAG: hypothetical protein Q4G27_10985 [Flavobacteriaceae bacterium]|nr:hypothetical protein [Flavobacteriaceae bacterium]
MKKLLIIFVGILLLTSCQNTSYIALHDAEKGMFLDRARRVSVNTFFDRRMQSELESQLSKDWYIVNEDEDFVYFGQLMKKSSFTMINPFYKVRRAQLDSIFPGYRSIEGKHIKAKVFQSYVKPVIEERLLVNCPQSYNIQYAKRSYKLTNEGILAQVNFTGKCYEQKIFKANLHVLLNPENLEVINAETNLK